MASDYPVLKASGGVIILLVMAGVLPAIAAIALLAALEPARRALAISVRGIQAPCRRYRRGPGEDLGCKTRPPCRCFAPTSEFLSCDNPRPGHSLSDLEEDATGLAVFHNLAADRTARLLTRRKESQCRQER